MIGQYLQRKGAEGFYFFSDDDKMAIRLSADTRWGKKIIADLKMKVKERRKYPLEVPKEEGGHFHDFFVQNIIFSLLAGIIRKAHYCSACDKEWSGNKRYDWAWIYEVHMLNKDYLYQCMYLLFGNRATGICRLYTYYVTGLCW